MHRLHRQGWLLILLLALVACARTLPEQALRQQMQTMQGAIEAGDAGTIEGMLAEDFIGNEGMDRREARRLATAMFMRYRDVGVGFGPLQVQLQGDHATASFTAVVTGGDGGALPGNGQVYDVTSGWRRDGNEWRLVNAQWKPKL